MVLSTITCLCLTWSEPVLTISRLQVTTKVLRTLSNMHLEYSPSLIDPAPANFLRPTRTEEHTNASGKLKCDGLQMPCRTLLAARCYCTRKSTIHHGQFILWLLLPWSTILVLQSSRASKPGRLAGPRLSKQRTSNERAERTELRYTN